MNQHEFSPRYPSRPLMQFIVNNEGRYELYTEAITLLHDLVVELTNMDGKSRFTPQEINRELEAIDQRLIGAQIRTAGSSNHTSSRQKLVEVRQNIDENHQLANRIRNLNADFAAESVYNRPTSELTQNTARIFVSGMMSLYTTLRILHRQYAALKETPDN